MPFSLSLTHSLCRYQVGCWFEEPFTTSIYMQASARKEEEEREREEAERDAFVGRDIEAWTVADVKKWLENNDELDQYAATFARNAVDGSVLCRLDHEMLRVDLGVTKIGHRFKIMDEARERRDAYYRSLERSKGNKWISERRRIESRIKATITSNLSRFVPDIEKIKLNIKRRSMSADVDDENSGSTNAKNTAQEHSNAKATSSPAAKATPASAKRSRSRSVKRK